MSSLPAIDINRDQTTGFTSDQYKQASEAISQVQNAENLRGQLIGLAKTRVENRIGLAELEGLGIGLQIAQQANQTKRAKLNQEISRTSIELMRVDELGIQGAILGTKIQGLNASLAFETQKLEQSQSRYQLELQAADVELAQLKASTAAAKQLTALKTKQTVTIPARRVA
jgi:hypothetical protein